MPVYIFDKEAFMDFIEKHFEEDTIAIVSSDFDDCEKEKIDSPVGLKDYFTTKGHVAADIFSEDDPDDFDGLMRYITVFCDKDEITEEAQEKIRTK